MYDKYYARGLRIIAVPCNQFADEEPDSNEQVRSWLFETYQIKFPVIEKQEVVGDNVSEIFQNLKKQRPNDTITWNFAKYLIDKNGKAVMYFEPDLEPKDMMEHILPMLKKE